MDHEWSFEERMQHFIAIEIANGAPDFSAYGDLFRASPLEIATRILAIPEIAEALEIRAEKMALSEQWQEFKKALRTGDVSTPHEQQER